MNFKSKPFLFLLALIVVGLWMYLAKFAFLKPSPLTPEINKVQTEETISENPTYIHIHSVFRVPTDGAVLLGAHTGLFKSTDNGKTFVRAQIKSTDSSINSDGEFMNFAYDAANKILYAGTHDSGLLNGSWSYLESNRFGH